MSTCICIFRMILLIWEKIWQMMCQDNQTVILDES